MRHPLQPRTVLAAAFFAATAWPLAALASSQLALDKGCTNCHGAILRGDAPSFERLSGRLKKIQGDAPAEQKWVEKFRAGEPLEHIPAHEQLTPESAQALVRWLAEGGK
jgi:cytochrome c551/c552